jgi:hypothetical protein
MWNSVPELGMDHIMIYFHRLLFPFVRVMMGVKIEVFIENRPTKNPHPWVGVASRGPRA